MSYLVPNTQTRLKIFFGKPMDSMILQGYVFSESVFLLLDQILSLEICLGSSCSVDMFQGSTIVFQQAILTPKLWPSVLESVRSFCTRTITQDGDSWLPPDLDPFSRNGPYGGNVQMRSVQEQHLTYIILRSTMQGLLNVLVIGGEDYDVEVEVFDLDWSLVGVGHVSETIRVRNFTERRAKTEDFMVQHADAKTT